MRRWILYAAILILLVAAPFQKMNISRLSPVQTVWVAEVNGEILLQTAGGAQGIGADIPAALENLNAGAADIVFLETADYLIIETGTEALLEQASLVFRPSCMVCAAASMPELEQATKFLRIHEPVVTLRQWMVEHNALQQLVAEEGRLIWNENIG